MHRYSMVKASKPLRDRTAPPNYFPSPAPCVRGANRSQLDQVATSRPPSPLLKRQACHASLTKSSPGSFDIAHDASFDFTPEEFASVIGEALGRTVTTADAVREFLG